MKWIEGAYVKSPSGSSLATITRPDDDTTAYDAGDVVGTIPATNIEFENAMPVSGEHYYITGLKLKIVKSSIPAGMTSFTLHLFSSAPTAIADNTAWTLKAVDADKYLGSIKIVPEDKGEVLIKWEDSVNMKRKLISGASSVFAQLVTDAGWAPTSEDVIELQLETIVA
jgi:hypothetical protein